jgi:hypothetical protein
MRKERARESIEERGRPKPGKWGRGISDMEEEESKCPFRAT